VNSNRHLPNQEMEMLRINSRLLFSRLSPWDMIHYFKRFLLLNILNHSAMTTLEQTNTSPACHKWNFIQLGGFDQIKLETGADLMALGQLDQKLWAALSCPTSGLEFDEKTLELIDTDGDGRIRVPEIIAAVQWAGTLLKNPDDLIKGASALPLSAIDDGSDEGKAVLASAREILKNLDKADATEITSVDTADTAKIFAKTKFNGDGIIPVNSADDENTQSIIQDIMACTGSEEDRCGMPGVSLEKVDTFFAEAQDYSDWWQIADNDASQILPYGDATADAATVFLAIKPKVDDYFTRCRLVEFDPDAVDALTPSNEAYQALSLKDLSNSGEGAEDMVAFPLASIDADKALPLNTGVNPVWRKTVGQLSSEIITPLLGAKSNLTVNDWEQISTNFSAYENWLGNKKGMLVEPLGIERVRELLANGSKEVITVLIAKDQALEPEANAVSSVDKLIRYSRDLYSLVNNFVSFYDFYTKDTTAVFQAGTLYLDARSCELCVKVNDTNKHSALAQLSRTYLAYCDCVRKESVQKMTIVAAITNGSSDNLRIGRNGIFYDRKGRDWDATIVKLIEHPISVRQAFWSPYKQISQFVSEQLQKISVAQNKNFQSNISKSVTGSLGKISSGKTSAAQGFDIAKFAGIFAAIGLALGAIGAAVTSVVADFFKLSWWQMPLAIIAILLIISGPATISGYFKLRRRNLGPILDACGWAVNTRAIINIPFGASLTRTAIFPPNSTRSTNDPYALKKNHWRRYGLLLIVFILSSVLIDQFCLRKWDKWNTFEEKTIQMIQSNPVTGVLKNK